MLALAAVVYLADRLTKMWALNSLVPGVRRPWLGEVLQLHLIFNPGAAFSFGTSATWVFTLIQAGVSIAIIVLAARLRTWPWVMGAGLALGGASGNLTDRLTREPGFGVGHVVDFLELPRWPIFNIADAAIVTAAAVVAFATMRGVSAFGGPPSASDAAPERASEIEGRPGERDG